MAVSDNRDAKDRSLLGSSGIYAFSPLGGLTRHNKHSEVRPDMTTT